jgi:pyruvate dehydrogenase E2 component (dihydrolipoamide acetyltransferase)
MIRDFPMPSLGADMAAATLVEWLKQPGQHVDKGETIAVVETQKGAIEVEAFESATVRELLAPPGAVVPVGTPIARLEVDGEAGTVAAPAPVPPRPAARRISPAARRLAAERGVDLEAIARGSGPGGAVTARDLEGEAPSAPRRQRPDLAAMRAAIGAAMARAKREIPHYYVGTDVDLTPALTWLEATNVERPPGERLLAAVLYLRATARALARFPEFNGTFVNGRFEPSAAIHLGVAVSLKGGGLIAPAILDAGELGLDALMARLRDLTGRARAAGLRASELGRPTITVSSLGERGVDYLLPIIHPPQVAILGVGRPATKPWVTGGDVRPRTVATLTLAADHRVSDGHRGALLLADIARRLGQPETL